MSNKQPPLGFAPIAPIDPQADDDFGGLKNRQPTRERQPNLTEKLREAAPHIGVVTRHVRPPRQVRESVVMSVDEAHLLDRLIDRAAAKGIKAKKTVVFRAALAALAVLEDADLFARLDAAGAHPLKPWESERRGG